MLKTHTVTQGDAYCIEVPLLRGSVTWPVQGWEFWFTVKTKKTDLDAAALIKKTSAALEIVQADPVTMNVLGDPADTKTLPPGRYWYDIQGKSPAGHPYTLEKGYFVIDGEVTQSA